MAPMTKSERVVKKMMTVFKNSIKIHDSMTVGRENEASTVRKPLVTKFMALFNSPDLSDHDKANMLVHMLEEYKKYAEENIMDDIYMPGYVLTASHIISLMLADPNVDVNAKNAAGESTAVGIWEFADDHEVLNDFAWMPLYGVDKLVANGTFTAEEVVEMRKRNAVEEKRVVIKRALLARDDLDMLALQSDDGVLDWLFAQYVESWVMAFINHPNFNVEHPEYGAKNVIENAARYDRHEAIKLINDLMVKQEAPKK